MTAKKISTSILIFFLVLMVSCIKPPVVYASEKGGGYAATNQLGSFGFTTKIYDATNGLPTSDANYILGAEDGYVWIGGYSGVIKYDGAVFERQSALGGLTSARCLLEDSKGRIWAGTNDNGVVCIDGRERTQLSVKDGLPSTCVRSLAEDNKGRIYVGTASGLCYINKDMTVTTITKNEIATGLIVRLSTDSEGKVYGYSGGGYVFIIENGKITNIYKGKNIGIENISNILADPNNPGKVYYGTYSGVMYYGDFGADGSKLKKIDVMPIDDVHWLSYDCERIWVASRTHLGYLDENMKFNEITDIPMTADMEMLTSDYQGNIWVASTTQGVMKLVSSNFYNVAIESDFQSNVVYVTYIFDNRLYVGHEEGLTILDCDGNTYDTPLSQMIGDARVRHIESDSKGNLWVSTFENDIGLVCQKADGEVVKFTREDGLPSNLIRCVMEYSDGRIVVGTNSGLCYIRNFKVLDVEDTVPFPLQDNIILSLIEKDGDIYVGTNGDGVYIISSEGVRHLNLDNGLTSDIVMRIKWDEFRGVYWLITSNSIQYIKNDVIVNVGTFPYNNTYDLYFDHKDDEIWILASNGIYSVEAKDMIEDNVVNYRHYTLLNGLTSIPTANAYSVIDSNGDMFVASRKGVFKFNIDDFVEEDIEVNFGLRSVICDGEEIFPDQDGNYIIPAGSNRVGFNPAILDYTESNPKVHMWLEGINDEGITIHLNDLKPLEYTGIRYGNYVLHLQIMSHSGNEAIQERTFIVEKKPLFWEMRLVQLIVFFLVAVLGGILAWRVLSRTIISRQISQLSEAKDEAARANMVKERFIANISNILRSPIVTIMGMDEMILRREPKEENVNDYFFSVINDALDIKKASEKLLEYIDALLYISSIESGKMALKNKDYDTVGSIRQVVSLIRKVCAEKSLDFDVEIDEKLPVSLHGDIEKISQIVLTLLNNAVKYTDIGGITLRISVDGMTGNYCFIKLSVIDTGLGVRDDFKEIIFKAFDSLANAEGEIPYEFDMGLTIAYKFAELMEGKLTCESEFGNGAQFDFNFRQEVVDATPVGAFKESDIRIAHGKYVPRFIAPDAEVLIVDNNPAILSIIKGLLKDTKMFVSTATSGDECLEKVKFGNYNVVIVDFLVPDIDGKVFAGMIHDIKPELPVYAMSTVSTEEPDYYKELGYEDFLLKPVNSDDLEKAILKYIPSNIYIKLSDPENDESVTELPAGFDWLYEIGDLKIEEGIRASGGGEKYIASLKVFREALAGYADSIEDAYKNLDLRQYTIKIHSLKTSFSVVGAKGLESMADSLEEAGNRNDYEYITDNTERLLSKCRMLYKELTRLHEAKEVR